MNYYEEIKNKLIDNEIYSKVKDYSKERHRIITYFEIGKLLNSAGNKYGDSIIDEYAKKLVVEVALTGNVGKKYDRSTLFKIKKFYLIFSNQKVAPLVPQLNWSHCLILIPLKDIDKINYYINQISVRNLSKRELREAIKNQEYERLPEETKNKLINKEETKVQDLIKDPIIIKNINNYEVISEKILQELILENIPLFLKELGNGFTFIDNEYKIMLGDRYNYIDLLLYNIKYKCYVVVELKITELKKEHIGQIKTYMNYIDENLKTIDEGKTIGIIIVVENNENIIKYFINDRIYAKEFELVC